ncbi:hypothetical protein J7438_24465 [Thalassotalea sp. G20_0]|uniref:hypothetical protein n=1 Tax=Thalassotalea sp. G20_0 TaxID=2821093 RepID=UPI001ADC9B15|nr:hypothetical protein [Thalassotalea sp. G20_0]MBO9497214.1 hypothetical protein [Thalassotalea sp. G20_0]
MNRLNLESKFISVDSCLQDSAETPFIPPCCATSLQPRMVGYSTQILGPFNHGYLNEVVISQNTPSSPRSINDFSISQLPSTENELVPPELSSEDLDEILRCDSASESVDNDFASTDLTSTNSQQIAQQLPQENSLADFSQRSSRPMAVVGPLNKDKQKKAITKIIEFKAPELSGSGEPLHPTPAAAHDQSKKGKASEQSEQRKAYQKIYQKAYRKSEKYKASQKAYGQSEKRKATKRTYSQSEKGKASSRAYEQSGKGKARRRAYEQSEKGKASRKAYGQSEKGKAAKRAWAQSEIGKAYQNAYQKAFKSSSDGEQAKVAGKQAATFIIESNKAKK